MIGDNMEENKVTKVVTTLNTGAAKPIAVSKETATQLAQEQSKSLEEQHEEKVRQLKIKMGEVSTESPLVNNEVKKVEINRNELPIETQAAVEELYGPKVMYKVVENKTNWKLVAILILVLLVIGIVLYLELSYFKV